ncbi:thiamine pyrophosphate-binding protein [Prochlorococcus sp. MIT 1300]|uniref:thiamine pyrophosphate-binding protein n=1 Tax=Prochlorococcus sp. MIT 1300 TaxID=3096218 RepID=UPI002A76296F|nr:thiamine pyrophosphate-binding protein [Prochlorococcus sp. MIT 1300]
MNTYKVSDFIAQRLFEYGVNSVFGVQGGAVVHLFDSLHKLNQISICYTHHEQAAALAAVANAKITSGLGACFVTTGPATTNAMTGLLAAWQDSTPVIFISGQTRLAQTSYGLGVRQRGSQECNVLDVVKPWCKFTKLISSTSQIDEAIDEAVKYALQGRCGPVWIDIPLDIQWGECTVRKVSPKSIDTKEEYKLNSNAITKQIASHLKASKRPLILFGRINYQEEYLETFFDYLSINNIPCVSTWGAPTISGKEAFTAGIIGVSGQPAANFAVKYADCIISLGPHLSITQSGNNFFAFDKHQKIIFINIDSNELSQLNLKDKSNIISCNVDANLIIQSLPKKAIKYSYADENKSWMRLLTKVTNSLSPQKAALQLGTANFTNPHLFICKLYSRLRKSDLVVIDGGGCALYAGFQSIPVDATFRVICSTSISAMGTGLPELCGASLQRGINKAGKNICIIGDGSLMFNLQELQTIKSNISSAIIIVINNSGYLAIRHTQANFLNERFYGTSGGSFGIDIPSIEKIASTFEYKYFCVSDDSLIDTTIEKSLSNSNSHMIIEVISSPKHENLFTASFVKNKDNSYSQQGLHLMRPFEDFSYRDLDTDSVL